MGEIPTLSQGVTSLGYDGNGNFTTVTDANGHTTTYRYDLAGRRSSMTVQGQHNGFLTRAGVGQGICGRTGSMAACSGLYIGGPP